MVLVKFLGRKRGRKRIGEGSPCPKMGGAGTTLRR